MGVQEICSAAATICRGISGINSANEDMPQALNAATLPGFVVHPKEGEQEWPRKPMTKHYTHKIYIDLYITQGADLAAVDHMLKPFVDATIDQFNQNIQLNGTCLNSGITSYEYGGFTYNDVQYLGIRFTLTVEELAQYIYHA